MKLKDILKTDTDNKGWLKVFKKLGADAEMLKYVNENISKSGGGGEINEYYYRVDSAGLIEYANGLFGEEYGWTMASSILVGPITIMYKHEIDGNYVIHEETSAVLIQRAYYIENLIAIKYSDILPTMYSTTNDKKVIASHYYGNINNRILSLESFGILPEDVLPYFTSITKEEYYALNQAEIIEYK